MAQLCSAAEKIEKLEFGLVILKGFDISTPTFVQLETVHWEVVDLKAKLGATPAMLEAIEKKVSRFAPWSKTLSMLIWSYNLLILTRTGSLYSCMVKCFVLRMLPVSLSPRKWMYKVCCLLVRT